LAMIRTSALESLRLGEIDVALAEMARIPDADRCPIDAKNVLATLWQAGRLEAFETELERATERWPESPEIMLLRAGLAQSRSNWSEAIRICAGALEAQSNYLAKDRARAELARSRFHEIMTRGERADRREPLLELERDIDQISATIRDSHAKSILTVARGRVAAELGDLDGAVVWFRTAISTEPQDAVAQLALAQFQYALIQKQLKESKSRGGEAPDPALAQRIRERSEEARKHARSVLSMRNRAKLPFSPVLIVTAAKLEAALAVNDDDKKGCLSAAEIGLQVCDEFGLPDRKTLEPMLEWARSSDR